MTRMRSRPVPSPSAQICAITVSTPWPIDGGAGDHLDSPTAAERDAHIVERAEPA
jgi:hypothetical protein